MLERAAELPGGHELLDAADEDGYTALHLVVIAGNSALLRFLISRRADVNKLDNERHSIVHWATGQNTTIHSQINIEVLIKDLCATV